MKCCEILFSKIKTEHSLFDDIPCKEEMICMSGASMLIVAKSILANHGIMAWSIDGQLQLDDGGENK
jgi:hypothetical protein